VPLVHLNRCDLDVRTRLRQPDGRVRAPSPDLKRVPHPSMRHQELALRETDVDGGEAIRPSVLERAGEGVGGIRLKVESDVFVVCGGPARVVDVRHPGWEWYCKVVEAGG
jgi:hypothetical protein